MATLTDVRRQGITGLVPPQLGEALIRETWPSVTAVSPALATLAEKLMRSILLAPLGWAIMLPVYFLKVLPFVGKRYAVTNRRVMIQRGITRKFPTHEVALGDIEDVRIAPGSENGFFRSATVEVLAKGQVALKMEGVPEPEMFRRAILNSRDAWSPRSLKAAEPAVAAAK